jgi:hypothetical protein
MPSFTQATTPLRKLKLKNVGANEGQRKFGLFHYLHRRYQRQAETSASPQVLIKLRNYLRQPTFQQALSLPELLSLALGLL